MEKLIKNKKIIVIVGVIVALVCVIVAFSGSGDICGTWEVSARSLNENLNYYPENNFVIYENGFFNGDGLSGTYSMNDDLITFNFSTYRSYTYEYDISGNTLMLRYVNGGDTIGIYYDRVS